MLNRRASIALIVWLLMCCGGSVASAQDAAAEPQVQDAVESAAQGEVTEAPASGGGRAQYPTFLANAFVNVNIGYIDYLCVSNSQFSR